MTRIRKTFPVKPICGITFREDCQLQDILKAIESELGLVEDRSRVVYTGMHRSHYAYIVYDLAYPENIEIVRKFCADRRIPLVGRFSQFEYLNMDACIKSAMEWVAQCG